MDQHRYFRSIEEHFIQLRGAPLLLSPADYQVAKGWWAEGIPLDIVHGALETLFARRAERGADSPIQSLRYCAAAVEASWKRARELAQADRREAPRPVEIGPRLEALAAAIPDSLAAADELRSETLALAGSTEEVEKALAELDSRLMAAVAASLDAAERSALEERIEQNLRALGERVAAPELDAARQRLFEQVLRRERGLPVLSLFGEL